MRTILHFLVRALFGYRTENAAVLQTPGPVVLLPNHTSWVDWLFIAVCLDTSWRFVTSKEGARVSWVHRLVMINRFTFPVETDPPFAVKRIAEYLRSGGKLVLFPEGRLSRTGALMKLFDGTGFLLLKTKAKVITCYIRGAHGCPFSPNPGRNEWFPRVSVHFSDVLTPPRFQGDQHERGPTKLTAGSTTRWSGNTSRPSWRSGRPRCRRPLWRRRGADPERLAGLRACRNSPIGVCWRARNCWPANGGGSIGP